MTAARDRVTAEPWPDLEAFLAWSEGQPERPLMESIERWRAERNRLPDLADYIKWVDATPGADIDARRLADSIAQWRAEREQMIRRAARIAAERGVGDCG